MVRRTPMLLALVLCTGCGDDDGAGNQNANGNGNGNQATPVCGNGLLELGETCDDGAENSDGAPDACRTDCRPAHCGDGVLDASEVCDDGAANSDRLAGACRHTCELPRCGDGVVDPGEDCDDGNAVAGDGCDAACAVEPHWSCAGAPSGCVCAGFWRGAGCDECVVYVSAEAGIEERDGRGWDTALAMPQEGIDAAFGDGPGCQVWVAAGRYPIFQHTQGDTVRLRSGVSVYGGFAGTEASLAERELAAHETTLDGEGDPPDALRVFHVLTAEDVTDATVDGFTVTHGRADGYEGTFDALGGGLLVDSSAITLQRMTFAANTADQGGAIFAYAADLEVLDSTLIGNASTAAGGAILFHSGRLHLERSAVQESWMGAMNTAAIHLMEGTRATVVDTDVSGTRAYGGSFGLYSPGRVEVLGGSFTDNGQHGLAIIEGTVADAEISGHSLVGLTVGDDVEVRGVTVTGNLIGMAAAGGVVVRDSTFSDNGGAGIGGVQGYLERCIVEGNGGPGVWFNGGTSTVIASRFAGNAQSGIRFETSELGSLVVTDSVIEDNAEGGVVTRGVALRLERCLLAGNTGRRGAAIASTLGSLTVESCVIHDNAASDAGGAIHALASWSDEWPTPPSTLLQVDVVSSVLHGNTAPAGGGTVLLEQGGVYLVRLALTSSIVWANDSGWLSLVGVPPGAVIAHACDLQDGLFPGPGNLSVDPEFVDPDAGDFHLQAGSPCIDTGDATYSATTDFEGDAFGVTPDIGAFAYP